MINFPNSPTDGQLYTTGTVTFVYTAATQSWSKQQVGVTNPSTSPFVISTTTPATSVSSGALQVAGGAGIAGTLYVGGTVTAPTFSGNLSGQATSVANALSIGAGLTTSAGTYNGSSAVSFSLNTATVMATALNAGTASKVANALTISTGLTLNSGSTFDGSTAVTLTLNTATLVAIAVTATHMANGTAGQIGYQVSPGISGYFGPGTAGQVLVSNGTSAPSYQSNLVLADTTNATSTVTGALQVVGGIAAGGNIVGGGVGYFGQGASSSSLTNPTLVLKSVSSSAVSGQYFVQAALLNGSATGSADYSAYVDTYPGPSSDHGWVDVGITGSAFGDPNFTITGKQDGYVFASSTSTAGTGNLVFATDLTGSTNDLVFATGGFQASNEKMRFINTTSQFYIEPTTVSTSSTTGALRVGGGVGIGGNLVVGGAIYKAITSNAVAVGTTYANAYQITTPITAFGTVNAGTGAILPIPVNSGAIYYVDNGGANALTLYAAVGGSIDAATNPAGVSIPSGAYWIGVAETTSSWASFVAPYVGTNGISVTYGNGQTIFNFNGVITSSTAVSSTGTGALQVQGGVGVWGGIVSGGVTTITNTTVASSTGTGALQVQGGVGVWGGIVSGGVTTITNTTVASSTGTGALQVRGGVGVWGGLVVGGAVTSTSHIITGATVASSTGTGALQVQGGVGVWGGLVVGGAVTSTSHIITGATAVSSTITGALQVAGGVGIGGSLYVGGVVTATNMYINGYAVSTSTSGSAFNGGTITNPLIVNNVTAATSTSSGALQVTNGGVGIGGGLYVGSDVNVTNGQLILSGRETTDGSIRFQTNIISSGTYTSLPMAGISFSNQFSPGTNAGMGGISVGKLNTASGDTASFLSLHTRNTGSSVTEQLRITSIGSVIMYGTATTYSTNSGALQVVGGAGIWGGLFVGGAVTSTSHIITGATVASSTGTGALQVQGGVGVWGGLVVGGVTTITNTTVATSTGTGALQVVGGIGVWGGIAAAGSSKFTATSVPSADMVTINNLNYPITTAGVNALAVQYYGGAAAVESGAVRLDLTPGTTTGGTWDGYRIVVPTDATTGVTLNAIKVDTIATPGAGTSNVLYAGTGWDSIINYNGTSLITGVGGATIPGVMTVTNTTAVSSTGTGALQVQGGVGVWGGIVSGGVSTITNTTVASSTSTGALQVRGGIGVGGGIVAGGIVTGTHVVAASGGILAFSTYTGAYSDGVVIDYVVTPGNGRISAGTGDTISFYNGGVGSTLLGYLPSNGSAGVIPSEQFAITTATKTLTASTTLQALFSGAGTGLTTGALTVAGATTYWFSCMINVSTMSATSGNLGFSLVGAGNATFTSAAWQSVGLDSSTPWVAANMGGVFTATTAVVTDIATAAAGTAFTVIINGVFRINAGGTIIPSIQLTTANAAVIGTNTWFKCSPVGSNTISYSGNWA